MAKKYIAVVGSGNWGTTLAKMYSENGYRVCLLGREEEVEILKRHGENLLYLPGYKLKGVEFASYDEAEKIDVPEVVLYVVPMKWLALTVEKFLHWRDTEAIVCTKGIDEEGRLPYEILEERGFLKICALSGPNIAREIARGLPASSVIASKNLDLARRIRDYLALDRFRLYASDDIRGVQLAGALKNVIAIAAGINDALGLGYNAKSALITRALVEMHRLGVVLGAKRETFYGLAGLGDLLTTSDSGLSRNWRVGYELGRGKSLSEIMESMREVAEGVYTVNAVVKLSEKFGVEMPITKCVSLVINGQITPYDAVKRLMSRSLKDEHEFIEHREV